MRKYKFVLLLTVVIAVFFILSWFVYDGIDIFFDIVYSPTSAKTETVDTGKTAKKKTKRTEYKSKDDGKQVERRDDNVAPDTKYMKSKHAAYKDNDFEKFLQKIFPEQLSYVLNPYTFFLLLVLSVLPIIGIFVYLIIYYLR